MDITTEIVRELLSYDPETGIFTWKARARHWFKSDHAYRTFHTRFAGKRAGTVLASPSGYTSRQINVCGKIRKEHRLAWIYMGAGELPEAIDHINRNATDNRWANIRASSYKENSKNSSKRGDNRSGFTGVSWHEHSGLWRARVYIDGKETCVGYYANKKDAAKAAKDFRSKKGFESDHGAELAWYHNDADSERAMTA